MQRENRIEVRSDWTRIKSLQPFSIPAKSLATECTLNPQEPAIIPTPLNSRPKRPCQIGVISLNFSHAVIWLLLLTTFSSKSDHQQLPETIVLPLITCRSFDDCQSLICHFRRALEHTAATVGFSAVWSFYPDHPNRRRLICDHCWVTRVF